MCMPMHVRLLNLITGCKEGMISLEEQFEEGIFDPFGDSLEVLTPDVSPSPKQKFKGIDIIIIYLFIQHQTPRQTAA